MHGKILISAYWFRIKASESCVHCTLYSMVLRCRCLLSVMYGASDKLLVLCDAGADLLVLCGAGADLLVLCGAGADLQY